MNRCYDQKNMAYKNYGGRGIVVCERWHNILSFIEDMGEKPKSLSLDRIDNDGPYSPENCRWATQKQQARNTRTNLFVEIGGVSRTLAEWSEVSGISYGCLQGRLYRGWEPNDILKPVTFKRRARRILVG